MARNLPNPRRVLEFVLKHEFVLPVFAKRGLRIRAAKAAVTKGGTDHHQLLILYHVGPLRDVNERTKFDLIPLADVVETSLRKLFGRTIGVRVATKTAAWTLLVKEPETWLTWLRHPDRDIAFRL